MSPENAKLLIKLKTLKANRDSMCQIEYLQQLRALRLRIENSLIQSIEVKYEEVKIIETVNRIIKPSY